MSVGSVMRCCTSCVVSQESQAYSYVGTEPPQAGTQDLRVLIVPRGAPFGQAGRRAHAAPRTVLPVQRLAVIALGGALGSAARYGLALVLQHADLPWATLTVNVLGALAIGLIAASPWLRRAPSWTAPFLITGVLGGFTTFSAFAVELGILLDTHRELIAAGYLVTTLVAGLVAVRIGAVLAPRLGRRAP